VKDFLLGLAIAAVALTLSYLSIVIEARLRGWPL
jgi:hypothetical protein